MHRSHLAPCLVMLVAAVLIAMVWGVQLGTLALIAMVLICPLVMLLMLRSMAGADVAAGHHGEGAHEPPGP